MWVALACATLVSPAAGQGGGSTPAKPGILDIEKIRKQMAEPPAADSGRSSTPAAIRLVPIRPVRIPGASFALGDTLENLVNRLTLNPDAGGAAGARDRVFAGNVRYFGQDAQARLHFVERWLSRAEIQTGPLTDAVRRYIVDEFMRQGYRRSCTRFDPRMVDCDWTGRTFVKMQLDSAGVIVDITLPDDPALMRALPPLEETATVASTDGTPIPATDAAPTNPETLSVAQANPLSRPAPEYPAMAREANVDGTVHVLAFVDESGAVQKTRVVRSDSQMLNDAALAAVRQWKFAPQTRGGRTVSFWVEVPVKFSLR